MPVHIERRIITAPIEKLFNIVADVKSYPEFLSWIKNAEILEKKDNFFIAKLVIGFMGITESYTSKVFLTPHSMIKVEYLEGPFKYLNNHWQFQAKGLNTQIDFFLDFELNSKFLELTLKPIFHHGVHKITQAFEERAMQE